MTRAQLDSRDAFLLTRIDGTASIAEVCSMSGFSETDTVAMLTRLRAAGLLTIEPAPAPARPRPVATPTPAPRPGTGPVAAPRPGTGPLGTPVPRPGTGPMGTPIPRPSTGPIATPAPQPASAGMHSTAARVHAAGTEASGPRGDDATTLRKYGRFGYIPVEPGHKAGDRTYPGFRFDRRELLEPCDLTLEQKKDVLFLFYSLERLDHFELLDLEPTDERKELKRAYFAFTKRFHPDAFFRKNLGSYAERVEKVFKWVTEIHDKLQDNQDLREAYCRAIKARNDGLVSQAAAVAEAAAAEAASEAQSASERRKAELAARLGKRVEERKSRADNNPMAERIDKAEAYYKEGMAHYTAQRFLQAANSIQLAVTYDPKNDTYKQAFDRVNEKAKQIKAETHWKRAYMIEQVGQVKEALQEYKAAVELWPRADYLNHTANLMFENQMDLNKAAEYAQKASDLAPQNVDYLMTLGQIYRQAVLVKRAIAVFERVVKLDSDNEIAKKHLKALKKM